MKRFILINLALLLSLSAFASQSIIVKANILYGESFVTVPLKVDEVESSICELLNSKGFHLHDSTYSNDSLLFFDFFIYQFLADYPTVALTVRSVNGIHYIDLQYVKRFISRKNAVKNLCEQIIDKLPDSINLLDFYVVDISKILVKHNFSLNAIRLSGQLIIDQYQSKYSFSIAWPESSQLDFIFPEGLITYLSYCVNLQGIRKYAERDEIKLILNINKSGKTYIADIITEAELTDKQKDRLVKTVEAFPTWIGVTPVESINLIL